jgi:hypothetical protein
LNIKHKNIGMAERVGFEPTVRLANGPSVIPSA